MMRYKNHWISHEISKNHDYPLTSDLEHYHQLCGRTNHEFRKLDHQFNYICKNILIFGVLFILNLILSVVFLFTIPLWIGIFSFGIAFLWGWILYAFLKDLNIFEIRDSFYS